MKTTFKKKAGEIFLGYATIIYRYFFYFLGGGGGFFGRGGERMAYFVVV